MGSLIIRADASTQIGTGHLMRCLALAQAWKDAGGDVTFITACQGEVLLQRLRDEKFDIKLLSSAYPDIADWNSTRDILSGHPGAWVVLDGYHFDEVYQCQVRQAGHRLLVIDDMAHLKHYHADIMLNQNLHAEQLNYSCEPYTRLLLGTRYVLLRREFLAWKDWKREIPKVARRVLVTLGGADPQNHTLEVIQALQKVDVPGLEATVVIGATNTNGDVLETATRQSRIPIHLVCDARNMPELMAWADVAVSGGGSTAWELLFMGTPAMFLILADNQRHIVEYIGAQELGKNLGQAGDVSSEILAEAIISLAKNFNLRATISRKSRQMVDGRGAQRVISSMKRLRTSELKLRPATFNDCRLLWEWSNDPAVRAASFSRELIPWEDHLNWYRQKLADPNCLLYIVTSSRGSPVGQVRFDLNSEGHAEIDISIAALERNKGYASATLRLACHRVAEETSVNNVQAHIKEGNIASIVAFNKAGFSERGIRDFKGHKAVEMIWEWKGDL